MAVITYLEAIRTAMKEEMERDDNVFVLGEDVGKGGVMNATKGLRDQFGEERVMDTPLAESAIAGVAIGAAMYGMKPVAEMQYADFIFPATNQIISEAALIRYRSNNDWNCPVVIRALRGYGRGRAVSLAMSRGRVLRHTGVENRCPVRSVRCEGFIESGDPRCRSGLIF